MDKSFGMWLAGFLVVAGLGGLPAHEVSRQAKPIVVDIDSLGPKVGETVPDFTLPDQRGTPRTLQSLLGPKGAILVFLRSADW